MHNKRKHDNVHRSGGHTARFGQDIREIPHFLLVGKHAFEKNTTADQLLTKFKAQNIFLLVVEKINIV